jgi:hypothetical protein
MEECILDVKLRGRQTLRESPPAMTILDACILLTLGQERQREAAGRARPCAAEIARRIRVVAKRD